MKLDDIKKKAAELKKRAAPVFLKAKPYVHTVDRIAQMAVQMNKLTPLGAIGLGSRLVDTIGDYAGNQPPAFAYYAYTTFLSSGQIAKAVEEAGGEVVRPSEDKTSSGSKNIAGKVGDKAFWIDGSKVIGMIDEALLEWLRQAFDRSLPMCIEAIQSRSKQEHNRGFEVRPFALTKYSNPQATQIVESTLPLITGGRCIMLDGKPGVGKTTLAQIIARDSGLGRVLVLNNRMISGGGDLYEDGDEPCSVSGRSVNNAVSLLSPGVIIVDDIDKVHLSLDTLESLRSSAKLVILTANNGMYDAVLDGAVTRAGRIDEIFSIAPVPMPRDEPFDRLTDDEWSEVSQWPVAYVNEVRKRLQHRPDDLRLDDLRKRLTRKTRSGDELL